MRKWRGDRRGRRSPVDNANANVPAGSEPEPLHPMGSAGASIQEPSPDVEPQAIPPAVEPPLSGAGVVSPQPSRSSRGRGRRRRKKPSLPDASPPSSKAQPLIPAYTATEGPRAPLSVVVTPGAPTGEAGELDGGEPPEAPEATPKPHVAAKPRQPKGAVVLSVGLPGSGKTTWFKRKGVTPLSSDLVRSLLFDNPTEQRHQDLVFSSLRSLLRARMVARMPMNYVDATNLSPKERRHWIRMAKEFGYEAQAVYFDVDLETCLERNNKRQRVVPTDVMQRMSAKLRPPTFDEGFSKIIVVRVKTRPGAESAPVEEASSPEPQGGEVDLPAESEMPTGAEPQE